MNKANIPQAIPMNSDLNGMLTPGEYYTGGGGESVANTPYTAGSFSLKVEYNGSWGHGVKQIWGSYYGNDTWTRVLDHQSWSPWLRLTTATPPEEHDLPLEAGCTAFMRSKYFKSQENIVTFYATVQRESGFSDGLRIATLPAGFRPLERTDFPATFSHFEDANARIAGFVMLFPDGGLHVAANVAGHSIAHVFGSFVTSA